MDIRMIATDLDGTLLRPGARVSSYTRRVLERCHEKGILLVFATARPERVTRQFGLSDIVSYVAANNGATVARDEKTIRNIPLPSEAVRGMLPRLAALPNLHCLNAETNDVLYTNDRRHQRWSAGADWRPRLADMTLPIEEEVCKIVIESGAYEAMTAIAQDYPEARLLLHPGPDWHTICHRDVSKWEAICHIAALEGIEAGQIMAFGDDLNDIDMLTNSGVGVAVENAVPQAKQAADAICKSNRSDGVATYIEEVLL